jgi:hypothetical protein
MLKHAARSCAPMTTAALVAALLAGCASAPPPVTGGAPVLDCAQIASQFSHAGTRIASAESVAAGAIKLPGIAEPMPAHCLVKGAMHERVSVVDGKPYAIGFEMRLPAAWNGRFFYQANGGLDGFVTPAYGDILGGGPVSNGLLRGFAVISSDAGHAFDRSAPIGGGVFGRDPQARRDYGYNAVAQLTPMAKALIARYYGKPPARSYLVGTSNGGRHGFVTASRLPEAYDGILATAPGFNLPRAAVAQVWGAQQFAPLARKDEKTGLLDLSTALPAAQLGVLAQAVLQRCDALDGLADGWVGDVAGCQRTFDPERDIPACPPPPATTVAACLPTAQKAALARLFAGPQTAQGQPVYAPMVWDAGVRGRDWAQWKLVNSVGPRDAVALAFVFTVPPASPAVVTGQGSTLIDYALQFSLARDLARITATDAAFAESPMQMMTPPDPLMRDFVARGGKLLVAHGSADPVFSALDTMAWYERFRTAHGAKAAQHARLFLVPGMNHSRGGPATDQMDLLSALVRWVEQGQAPERVVAAARGPGAGVPNPELPAHWSPTRTRLLCPHPQVARYQGGDPERAESFACE